MDRALNLAIPAALIAVNVYICRKLFGLGFSTHMDSIESVYMSISRYATRNWGDLTWFPLWHAGMPFVQVYQPGLHLTVAAFSTLLGISVERVYHSVTALAYVLGPVTLYFLCKIAFQSRTAALIAAAVYSLISPVNFFAPVLAHDTGGFLHPRRLWVLVKYGEGPHTTALMLLPLTILLLHLAVSDPRWHWLPLASLALGAVVTTNWPGTVALSLAVAAYLLSRLGQHPAISWIRFAGACVCGYLIISPWIPPSMILFIERNAQKTDATTPGAKPIIAALIVFVVLLILHFCFTRLGVNPWLRFFVYFTWLTGALTLGYMWFDVRLIPQPWRFQVEFELGIAGIAGYLAAVAFAHLRERRVRYTMAAVFVLLCVIQIRTFSRFGRSWIGPTDVTKTIEYRMAKAFEQHSGAERVFAPGDVSLWLNMFTDVPQIVGCCDQSVPNFEQLYAAYVIYSGQNAGDRDAYISLVWLKAYGAHAVGVTGKNSTEPFKPFVHPEKFQGLLPEVWRDGDDVIYNIPSRSDSLAHVIRPADVIRRPPVNGLDIQPIEPYVHALDDPGLPLASTTWINCHQMTIHASTTPDELVSVQETYDKGWRAEVKGSARPVTADALGMMVIEPQCSGPCTIDLVYDRTAERIGTDVAAAAGVLIPLVSAVLSRRKRAAR